MSGNELPKVIDKSQADIDAAIAAIKASDMSSGTKDFAISCIKLAIWLPKAHPVPGFAINSGIRKMSSRFQISCFNRYLVLPILFVYYSDNCKTKVD